MRTNAQSRSRTTLALLVGTTLLAVAPFGVAMGAANADSDDPPGNNGTVKVEGVDLDAPPDNNPHQGCVFTIEWYGFDQGANIISNVTFSMQAPTADVGLTVNGPSSVFVGGDDASGAGTEAGLDGRQVYTLSFVGDPHPQQGYHIDLTVNTPGSIGNDSKSKVFWVEGCAPPPTTPPPTTPPPTTPPPTTPPPTTPPPTTPPPTTPPPTTPPVATTPPVSVAVSPTSTPTVSPTTPTVTTEVEGEQVKDEQVKDKDKTPVEVLGEQAVLPTQVDAGLAGDMTATSSSSSQLWLAGMTGLLAAAIGLGLLSSRRTRGRA